MDIAAVGAGYDESIDRSTGALQAARSQRVSLRRAIAALEDALAAPAAGRTVDWGQRVTAALEHLAEVFELHVAVTERPGGLYDEIIELAPRLANKVDRFRVEHVEITEAIQAGIARCRATLTEGGPEDPATAAHLRERLLLLLARLTRHRQRGADLVYEAYAVDIGGES